MANTAIIVPARIEDKEEVDRGFHVVSFSFYGSIPMAQQEFEAGIWRTSKSIRPIIPEAYFRTRRAFAEAEASESVADLMGLFRSR
jgi:hypothetical protein